ncbi:valine--tRNA ligase [Candidatus Saccharibacteria bacterium]|nr:valine--tRNA ligase [Candidatus Saccharibacteria bacterium]
MRFSSSYEPGEYESDIYAAWEASGIFNPKVPTVPIDNNSDGSDDRVKKSNQTFSIVMPPPNANGNLHIGHGLTIALEDSLIRYYRLKGDSTWYIPGADHAGFETWVVYERELEKQGHTRFEYSRDELYARVWDFVAKQRGNMELQLRALGASCSWDDLTFTLDENVIDRVYTTFEKMWNDGLIYRGEKLVNYCPKHQTAFADIEVEHQDEKGTLWDIAYQYDGGEIIVSTTRPETLFGDAAVAVNPEDKRYQNLLGQKVKLPLTDREIPIIADEHADPEFGTGAVKITPAHDFDDFEVGERHNLPRLQVIAENGTMVNVPEEFNGLTTTECRKKVLKTLKEQNLLRGERKIDHAVAHCYKCGTTIEPMLKEQWFIDVKKLAKLAIDAVEQDKIKFHPANKKNILINYYKGLKDWNISRQIPWGIAIPMFRKVDLSATDEPDWIFDRRTNLQEIEKAGVKYVRDEDTFDTWFSSSHWPIVCTDWDENNINPYYPLNVMETGADILFAWVARMIMMGLYVTGEVPFKEVYLHGLVLDEHGKKMSKSKGNVINPMDLVTKYGSDAFRLGILRGRSAGMNQAFSENSVIAGRNLCNKLWNISRLIQSMADETDINFEVLETVPREGYDPSETSEAHDDGSDQMGSKKLQNNINYTSNNMGEDWICREINECVSQVEKDMKAYRFAEAVEVLYQTIWDKYADWFLETQKVYKNIPLLKTTLETLLITLHPFAPFVTETIWQNLSWTEGFIAAAKWPSRLKFDPISAEEFESIRTIVSEVRGTLQALPGTNNAKKYGLLYDNDSIVNENMLIIKNLTKVPSINSLNGNPRGLRIALANHEIYLDVPEDIVMEYKETLTEKILSVGKELDALNARLMNPNYVDRAPAHLVKETRDGVKEKESLINRLKQQLELI